MDVVTFFRWNSKASKTTLLMPFIAILLTVAFFILYLFPESQVSEPVFERASALTISIIVTVVDVILILLMFYFQPTKTPAAKKKEEEEKLTVVVSAEKEDTDNAEAKEEDRGVEVKTQDEQEDEKLLDRGLAGDLEDEPELEAVPDEAEVPVVDVPKPAAMVKSVITFPEDVGGGIYGDTYISVGNGTTLKLRQEVVEEIYLVG